MAKKVRKFDAEIGKVLQLMINSIYTNKDIFLRELISNASDACDKRRYESLHNPALQNDEELKIKIIIGKDSITIADNGIGMNNDDLINNLGTIAGSGTQRFLENLASAKESLNLIGQFGVGFYSAFMVGQDVTVLSRKAGEAKAYKWFSDGKGEYSLEELKGEHQVGTSVIIKLKNEDVEFLDKFKLRHIINTYSDHISFPIDLVDEEGKSEKINSGSALWVRPKNEISEEQYNEFYHHVSHLPDTPWLRMHIKAEGNIEYNSLLYVPSIKPFDLFHPDRKTSVKLYVKKVFITEEAKLIPAYMRFMRGVVDSEDLPLNISRETLQHNLIISKISKSIVKKVFSELKAKAKDDAKSYNKFWENFGEVMKEGLCEPALEEKEQLLEVCRFHTTKSDELISLDEYIDRMVEGQEQIFYITGDHLQSLKNHPQLEGFNKRGIEVLLLADHVDDFWVNAINAYKNKELSSVNASNVDLDKISKLEQPASSDEKAKLDDQELIEYIKKILGATVREVRVSHKLVDSPSCLAVPMGAMSARMERYLIDQKQLKSASAKVFEINPHHPILLKIAQDVSSGKTGVETEDLVRLIFDQACILEGEPVRDPNAFMRRVNNFIVRLVA